jgi:hypothetical protein
MLASGLIKPVKLIDALVKHARQWTVEFPGKRVLPAVYELLYPPRFREELEDWEPIFVPEAIQALNELRNELARPARFPWLWGKTKPCVVRGGRFYVRLVEVVDTASNAIAIHHRLNAGDSAYTGIGTVYVPEEDDSDISTSIATSAPVAAAAARVIATIELPDGARFEIRTESLSIGRACHCDVVIEKSDVSREHLRLRYLRGQDRLEVFECSSNWTLLNGTLMKKNEWIELPDDARLALTGGTEIRIWRTK